MNGVGRGEAQCLGGTTLVTRWRICGLNKKNRGEERANGVTADKTVDIITAERGSSEENEFHILHFICVRFVVLRDVVKVFVVSSSSFARKTAGRNRPLAWWVIDDAVRFRPWSGRPFVTADDHSWSIMIVTFVTFLNFLWTAGVCFRLSVFALLPTRPRTQRQRIVFLRTMFRELVWETQTMEPTLIESWNLSDRLDLAWLCTQILRHHQTFRSKSKLAAFSSCNLPLCLPAFCGAAARRTVRRSRRRCRSRGQFSACTQYSLAAFCIIKGEPCRFITASIPWLVKGFTFPFQRCWHFLKDKIKS